MELGKDKILAVRNSKTIYRHEDKVIKLFDESFSKADILNEALNQARVEETGLKIPKLLEVTTIDGKWAIVLEYIEGKTLEQLMKEHPEKKDEYLNLFIDLQMEILLVEGAVDKLDFDGALKLVRRIGSSAVHDDGLQCFHIRRVVGEFTKVDPRDRHCLDPRKRGFGISLIFDRMA